VKNSEDGKEEEKQKTRRVMQVVEVEDAKEAESKPPEPMTEEKEERIEEKTVVAQVPPAPEVSNVEEPRLEKPERRDVVSELFQTSGKSVSYPDVSIGKKRSPFSIFLWVAVVILVASLIGGGLIYMKNQSGGETPKPMVVSLSPTPTVAGTPTATATGTLGKPTPTATVSATPTPKKGILNIQVLNGSGKSGAASAMKKLLEDKGYAVVGTGNAKTFDYEKTEVYIKKDKESLFEKLKTDISVSYSIGSSSATLETSSSFDAQVIVGKE